MHLLSTTLGPHGVPEIKEFHDQNRPPYAILSHTWGDDEVLFADLKVPGVAERPGFRKIQLTLHQAREDGLQWAWVDTACINKDSSAELSEAINAMFSWYQEADVCYVYLSDINADQGERWPSTFHHSRWFSRGWTLQELLAPHRLVFYTQDWDILGHRSGLSDEIEVASGIGVEYLTGASSIYSASIARRMSWASSRKTTRIEDKAYSLMGLFDVNMPMLYGEGSRAFLRLQEEIMKTSDDQSLFAWTAPITGLHGLLADSPRGFKNSRNIAPLRSVSVLRDDHTPHVMTSRGLRVEAPCHLDASEQDYYLQLECAARDMPGHFPRIILSPTAESPRHFARRLCGHIEYTREPLTSWTTIYVRQRYFTSAVAEPHRCFIQVLDVISSFSPRCSISGGAFLDIIGERHHGEEVPWMRRCGTIMMVTGFNLLGAFLDMRIGDFERFFVLIGTDTRQRLAFDIWEPTFVELEEERLRYGPVLELPQQFRNSFHPTPCGTIMSLSMCDVAVSIRHDGPVAGIEIHCTNPKW